MQQYKFRGKRKDNGEWAYGFLLMGVFNDTLIQVWENGFCHTVVVMPETVGQLTGLAEKNGKDVYEGDIVKFHYFFLSLGENLGVQESEHELIGIVIWGEFGWSIDAIRGQHWEGYTGYRRGEGECSILELYSMNQSSIHEESLFVIGNIHDVNPASGQSGINNMQDPNTQQQEAAGQAATAEVTNEQATTDQVAAVEQEAQEQAMESAEEGTAEG